MTNPTDGHPTTTSDRPRLPRRRRVPLRTHLPLSAESGFVCLAARMMRAARRPIDDACMRIDSIASSVTSTTRCRVRHRGRAEDARHRVWRFACGRDASSRPTPDERPRRRAAHVRAIRQPLALAALALRRIGALASRCRFTVPFRRTASPRAPRSVGSTRRFAVPPRCIDAPYRYAATARRRRLHRFPASARHAAPMRSLTPPSCRFAARRSRSST